MLKNLPTILIFTRYYLPGFRAGGPVRSIQNLASRLSEDFNFFIVTMDRDKGDEVPYSNIHIGVWNRYQDSSIYYLPREEISLRRIRKIIEDLSPDAIYLNSYFDPVFTQKVLFINRAGSIDRVPIILAPRGEFSLGALSVRPFKKKAYIVVSSMLRLYEGLIWQASSVDELNDIRKIIGFSSNICIARNLTPVNELALHALHRKFVDHADKPIRLSFLSRISPKKNLHFALEVLSTVEIPLIFSIYGPIDDVSYWRQCEEMISSLPKNIVVRYEGEVLPENVRSVLAMDDMFFFPTLGENYGHVIFEALSSGLPVLISDQTPWHNVEELGIGWEVSLSAIDKFAERIQAYARCSIASKESMRINAIAHAARLTMDESSIGMNKALFELALASRHRP
jgi:glycosyltransferase involved in cell wall biosynthesis